MGRPSSLHIVPVLAVLLPCVLISLIGYKWIALEREAEARRGEQAAEAEAVRIHERLVSQLVSVASDISRSWSHLPADRPPFAPSPPLPEMVASAFVLTPAGKLIYPDYHGAYLYTIRAYESATAPVKAAALLSQGRLSLTAKRYREAEASAQQIIHCCAAVRDEYGVSFALYAAVQIAAASEAQGRLCADFSRLARQLGELLRRGEIGHPSDLQEIAALAARVGGGPEASLLLSRAEEQARRIGDPGTMKAISLAGGKPRVVVTVDDLNPMMALSPDGRRIAYMAGGRGQGAENFRCEMSLMSIDGESLGQLLPLQQDYITPNAWSPDGAYLLYKGKEGPRVMNVGTRESWPIHNETSNGSWEGGSWSPDGTFILLVRRTQTEDRLAWEGITYDAVIRLLEAK